ncbi:MAG: hypothetical protein CML66_08490 [Rhodobacteraceae bacterium]|nr:hypothetical protein [Paracoccaceae bacterium]MAY45451.1 hypothetical protein [Paracoccaceae bacterium]
MAGDGADGARTVGLWLPLPVMIVSLFLASFWLHLISGAGRDGGAVVLVFPPTWSRTDALAATGSLSVPIVDTGRLPFIYAVQPDGPETVASARAAGALLVLKSPALALCRRQAR